MKDFGFIIAFFFVLLMLALVPKENGGIFSKTATSTTASWSQNTLSSGNSSSVSAPPTVNTAPKPPKLSPEETERKVAELYRTLDSLKEDVRKAKLREPSSPYQGLVTLSTGNVYETDPDREYLSIRMNGNGKTGINISNWYLKSYVTDEASAIPYGDRVIMKWRSPDSENIVLLPNESAYIITGKSPIDTSFHENACTGYLASEGPFTPYLSTQCPRPIDEMKRYGKIDLDNDSCYTFVERIQTCQIPSEESIEDADLTNSCQKFIEDTLNYNDCVLKHVNDPLFDDVGTWHIYLEENSELWRPKREIIRLMDENDRVVDVLEY